MTSQNEAINSVTLLWADVVGMINHWASCPENGYFGSSYGGKTHLHKFANGDITDQNKIVEKLQKDVPYTSKFVVEIKNMDSSEVEIAIDGKTVSIKT